MAGHDLDELLEREFRRHIAGLRIPSPRADQATYRAVATSGGKRMPLLSSLTAVASSKAVIGLATAALVIGGGSVAATAATGSANPANWSKTVTDAMSSCKSRLGPDQHGIGHCVSAVASQKGQQERSQHAASAARQLDPASTPSAHQTGAQSGHPTGAPAPHPTGRPTDVPTPHATSPGHDHPTPPAATPTPR
ncbi:MAG: hypothetical protein E6J41_11225 [Chloroflexi bacterium]|nr:MAG: hypothetical protein E6J41_11225 [Chloroflexota bacterium]